MKTGFSLQKSALVALCAAVLAPASLFAGHARTSSDRGVIKSVDASAHMLVVTDKKSKIDQTFQWNDKTRFMEHEKAVTASALTPGMPVHLTFEPGAATPTIKKAELWPAKAQQHASHRSH